MTYIRTTPDKLWAALTETETIPLYWLGMHCESEWKAGSPYLLGFSHGRVADVGEILEAEAPKKLAIKWRDEFRRELAVEGHSTCTMTIEALKRATKLTVPHTIGVDKSKFIEAVSSG